MFKRKSLWLVLVVGLALAGAGAGIAAALLPGRISIAAHLTANGRHLTPPGRLVTLGQFPTGGAMTPDGRFYWTVSTGRAFNDVRIVSVAAKHPHVVQVLALPGASGGIAIDRTKALVYVSGIPDSSNTDEKRPNLPGGQGDVIHVFRYDKHRGRAHEVGTIPVPPPSSAQPPLSDRNTITVSRSAFIAFS